MKRILFLLLLLHVSLNALEINLLDKASIYVDKNNTEFKDIKYKQFEKISIQHINYGFNSAISLWIKFELSNNTSLVQESLLVLNNPLLEHVTLYDEHNNSYVSGMLHVSTKREHINPSFPIKILAQSTQEYYLHVSNATTALQFSLTLNDKESFQSNDKAKQFFITLFIGIIGAFLIYALALFFYTKDESYFYYSIYIAALVFQQLTYIGFLPLYMPQSFTYIDNLIVVPKVGIMIITAAIFAKSFLKTSLFMMLDKVYSYFIYGVIFSIILYILSNKTTTY